MNQMTIYPIADPNVQVILFVISLIAILIGIQLKQIIAYMVGDSKNISKAPSKLLILLGVIILVFMIIYNAYGNIGL